MPIPPASPLRRSKLVAALIETFGFSPLLASIVAVFVFVLAAAALLWVVLSAPPRTITMITGPEGSTFQRYALGSPTTSVPNYRDELARHGVTLRIVPSNGSEENLHKLQEPGSGIDIGFVQGGLVTTAPKDLVSLGSVAYQPVFLFYRSPKPIELLSELAGRRIGIGSPGSGVHILARALLEANGITGAPTQLVADASGDGGQALIDGKLDAIFLMGDSAPTATLRKLVRDPAIHLYSFVQADAYIRRMPFLNRIVLPRGSIDFGADLPARDVVLVGPTVELVARKRLNSAISDLLLTVARTVHGRPTLLAKRGEFPAPLERDFTLSDGALRFYKSGRGFTYSIINSFWLASLINRLLVAVVPIFLVLIPTVRFFPVLYRWTVQLRIFRCYRPLLRLERSAETPLTRERAAELLQQLDAIERDVNGLKVPASFANQFYDLRSHVAFVRHRLETAQAPS